MESMDTIFALSALFIIMTLVSSIMFGYILALIARVKTLESYNKLYQKHYQEQIELLQNYIGKHTGYSNEMSNTGSCSELRVEWKDEKDEKDKITNDNS